MSISNFLIEGSDAFFSASISFLIGQFLLVIIISHQFMISPYYPRSFVITKYMMKEMNRYTNAKTIPVPQLNFIYFINSC